MIDKKLIRDYIFTLVSADVNVNVDDPFKKRQSYHGSGVSSLIAMLFLNDWMERASREGGGNEPSDKKVRQLIKVNRERCEGYRLAARSYAKIGLEALISHVVNYQTFPSI